MSQSRWADMSDSDSDAPSPAPKPPPPSPLPFAPPPEPSKPPPVCTTIPTLTPTPPLPSTSLLLPPLTPSEASALVPPSGLPSSLSSLWKPPTKILPSLYLGDASSAARCSELCALGITLILNVAEEFFPPPPPEFPSLHLKHCPLSPSALPSLLSSISSSSGSVLVHCGPGVSSAPFVVLSFLVSVYGWSLADAWGHVSARRKVSSPSPQLWEELRRLSMSHLSSRVSSLEAERASLIAERKESPPPAPSRLESIEAELGRIRKERSRAKIALNEAKTMVNF